MNPSQMVKRLTDEELAKAAKNPRTSLGRHAANEIMNRTELADDTAPEAAGVGELHDTAGANETLSHLRRIAHDLTIVREDRRPAVLARNAELVGNLFEALDDWLSRGGALPDDWREDRVSSPSRQHFIETGRYLTREDYADPEIVAAG